jgi:hypothetical protein
MAMTPRQDWPRLAQHVRERRVELGMTQEDVRAAGGPSTATMTLIEGAKQDKYELYILARLENALRWRKGSIRDILAGGDALPLGSDRPEPGPDDDPVARLADFARWLDSQPDDEYERAIRVLFRRNREAS